MQVKLDTLTEFIHFSRPLFKVSGKTICKVNLEAVL